MDAHRGLGWREMVVLERGWGAGDGGRVDGGFGWRKSDLRFKRSHGMCFATQIAEAGRR